MIIRWTHRAADELIDAAARHRISVVTAVAGWGKTEAVTAWARTRRTTWTPAPETGADAVDWLREQVREGDGDGDRVLVLDDLHRVHPGSPCARYLEQLCLRLPAGLNLIALSRAPLPFDVAPLRDSGLLAEVGAAALALDVATVAEVLRETVGEDPPGLAARVWAATGGWPVAVRHALDRLQGVDPTQRLAKLAGLTAPGTPFHYYLATSVLAREPSDTRELLYRLATVGEADQPPDDLGSRGLLWRSGTSGQWRLVPPLAEFLADDEAPSAGERVALHRAAARECLRHQADAQALRHLAAGGDHAGVATLLGERGDALIRGGRADAVLEALRLPASQFDHARSHRVLGTALLVRGQCRAAGERLRRAAGESVELTPDLAYRMCGVAFVEGDLARLLDVVERTRFGTGDDMAELRVLYLAATTQRATGDLGGLKVTVDRVVRAGERRCGPDAEALVRLAQAMQCEVESDRRAAETHEEAALAAAEQAGDVLTVTWLRVCRAAALLEHGAPGPAAAAAADALRSAEKHEVPFLVAHARTVRGRARLWLGSLDEAHADLVAAAALFQDLGSRWLAWPLCGLGDLYRLRGQLVRARAAYEEALALAEAGHEVLGLGAALIGLARVRAADDTAVARAHADRALGLGEALRMVPAHLARGWVELLEGNREGAAADAALAAAQARQRHELTGIAEAISLTALASPDPTADPGMLREAIDIWRETGCRAEGAAAVLVAENAGIAVPGLSADDAAETLRACGLDPAVRRGAGTLGALAEMPHAVAIHALGVFRVTRNGVTVPRTAWQSRKARDVLRILVARERPVPRDQLMEMLWPGTDPSKSGNRLSVLLSTVRDVLAPVAAWSQPLATDGTAVWLDPTLVSIDVEQFRKVATRAVDAHRSGHPDAADRLAAAARRYTGDLFEDDPYAEWAQPAVEELRALRQSVLRALIGHRQAAGEVDEVVWHTLRLLSDDPYDEQAHVNLVTVLLAAGRIGEAHRRYGIYRRQMREMGLDAQPIPGARAPSPARSGIAGVPTPRSAPPSACEHLGR